MNLLVPGKHCNKFPNFANASFGFLYRLNSKENRVAIGTVESLENSFARGLTVSAA
jgi:hypothetical protein